MARARAWRGWLLEVLSRLFNYEGPGGAPAVTVELLREGEVGAVLSVLFEPFDEMDLSEPYGAPPKPEYFTNLKGRWTASRRSSTREHELGRARLVRNPKDDGRRDGGGRGRVHPLHRGRASRSAPAEAEMTRNVESSPAARRRLHHARAPVLARRRPERAGDPVRAGLALQGRVPEKGDVGLTPLGEAACARWSSTTCSSTSRT